MFKKILSFFLPVIVLAGCEVAQTDESAVPVHNPNEFTAESSDFGNGTRTSLDGLKILWNEGDQISIFQKNTTNSLFALTKGVGTVKGTFSAVAEAGNQPSEVSFPVHVAVSPYSQEYVLLAQEGTASALNSVQIPSEQTYIPGSYDPAAFPMIAVSEGNDLRFKHLAGLLKIQLTGTARISKIVVSVETPDTWLSGMFSAQGLSTGSASLAKQEGINYDTSNQSVTLVCREGVQLNETEPVPFYLSMKPAMYEGGFTVTVYDVDGKEHAYTASRQELGRGQILVMPALTYVPMTPEQKNNEIWVKPVAGQTLQSITYNNEEIVPQVVNADYWKYVFPVQELSAIDIWFRRHNEIEEVLLPKTTKVLKFDAFRSCNGLKSISLPEGLEEINSSSFGFCNNLTEITLPNSLLRIKEKAFLQSGLRTVNLSKDSNLRNINQEAFSSCNWLTKMVFPKNLQSIGNTVLLDCPIEEIWFYAEYREEGTDYKADALNTNKTKKPILYIHESWKNSSAAFKNEAYFSAIKYIDSQGNVLTN